MPESTIRAAFPGYSFVVGAEIVMDGGMTLQVTRKRFCSSCDHHRPRHI